MAKDGKFGTFAGVYLPSLLTILGVIMYLRLPWIVGNVGLYTTLGIIVAAHIVSICTGLSVSSIATDKKVGAGGPYYMISRSLGLPIGGSIGVALFVGMGFAIALHIVGFSESVLSALDIPATPNAIRIAGTLTLIAITAVAFISTSLAIKIQYPILVLVAASVAVIFLGKTDHPASPQLGSRAGAPSFAVMFGIFFPAATGFMSGVNMSGDLRDPKRSIIRGTVTAILTALALYVALTVFLAFRFDSERLRTDTEVLEHMALWGPAVVVGIWGATLSSAFGAVLGAPRILQAMSGDRITPRALAKGHGPLHEPRRATLVAFTIAEAGILIAELNVIARIVSMIYLTEYAFINIACALESWASPDFRPKFRLPKAVSIVGAVTCVALMIQLDLIATLGATVLMIGLFVYLQRRQLTLESGDAWEGVWSTVVRAAVHRLHNTGGQQRNWRPNVLLFDEANHARHAPIRSFAATLASGNGMVTDFALAPSAKDDDEPDAEVVVAADKAADKVGVFDTSVVTDDPFTTIASLCQFHGFPGLAPNTLLLPWRQHAEDPDKFLRVLAAATSRDLNILLFEEPREARRLNRQIDVWWARDAGNLALSVALGRFITRANEWERAAITLYIVGSGTDDDDVLRTKAVRYLETNRIDARVQVVHRPHGELLHDLVCNESRTADLVLLGLPTDLGAIDRASLERLDRVASLPGGVVFLRSSAAFVDVLPAKAAPIARIPRAPGAPTPPAGIPVLALPRHADLAATVTALRAHVSTQLTHVQDRIAAAYELYLDLCATARALVADRAAAMIAAVDESNPIKRRKQLADATNKFLVEADRALAQITATGVAAQATLLGEALTELVKPTAAMPPGMPSVVHVEQARSLFAAAPEDSRAVRRWKRRRRWRYFYRKNIVQSIAIMPLVQREHDRIVTEEVARIVARFQTSTHDLAVEISRALATAEWKAHAQLSRATLEGQDMLRAATAQSRDETLRRLDGIATHTRERIEEHARALDAAAFDATRKLSATLDRIDAPLVARAAAKGRRRRDEILRLPATTDDWRDQQLQLLARARLAVRLARFRDRLTIASARALEEIISTTHGSGHHALIELRDVLAKRAAEGTAEGLASELRDELPYDASPIIARFAQVAAALSGDLPEAETLLTDDAAAALVRGDVATDMITVPVRAAVQGIVEAELITRFGSDATLVAEADARAWAVARETMLLVAARPRESDHDDATETASLADAVARLDAQLGKLREVEASCIAGVLDGLQAVASATSLDALATSLAERGGHRSNAHGPSRVAELTRRTLAGLRDLGANAIYRRSAGIVYAQQARAARSKTPQQTIRGLTARATISASVASTLPLYYRNLFIGQVNINESFFVGRDAKVKAGVDVVTGDRGSGLRTALVSGQRGAGKTTVCQQIASSAKGDIHWVSAPPGGGSTGRELRTAFETSIGRNGSPAQLVGGLREGSVIVIDDLDLWWERRPGGLEAIDAMLDLISSTADRMAYVIAGSEPALRVLHELRPISRQIYAQLDCQPLTARGLEDVIMARHRTTGFGLKLGERDALGSWTRARLFNSHFDYARGNVGYALRSWMTHIDGFADDKLTVRMPVRLDWDAFDDLRAEHVALLVELALHKAASVAKLERLTGRPAAAIEDGVAELTAIGLVVQNRRKIAQLNPFVHGPVIDWLERRELA